MSKDYQHLTSYQRCQLNTDENKQKFTHLAFEFLIPQKIISLKRFFKEFSSTINKVKIEEALDYLNLAYLYHPKKIATISMSKLHLKRFEVMIKCKKFKEWPDKELTELLNLLKLFSKHLTPSTIRRFLNATYKATSINKAHLDQLEKLIHLISFKPLERKVESQLQHLLAVANKGEKEDAIELIRKISIQTLTQKMKKYGAKIAKIEFKKEEEKILFQEALLTYLAPLFSFSQIQKLIQNPSFSKKKQFELFIYLFNKGEFSPSFFSPIPELFSSEIGKDSSLIKTALKMYQESKNFIQLKKSFNQYIVLNKDYSRLANMEEHLPQIKKNGNSEQEKLYQLFSATEKSLTPFAQTPLLLRKKGSSICLELLSLSPYNNSTLYRNYSTILLLFRYNF